MSSDYPYGEGPTLKEFLARAEAKGINVKAEVNRAMDKRIVGSKLLPLLSPKPFPRGESPMTPEPPSMLKSQIKARKRKRRLQKLARRRNR